MLDDDEKFEYVDEGVSSFRVFGKQRGDASRRAVFLRVSWPAGRPAGWLACFLGSENFHVNFGDELFCTIASLWLKGRSSGCFFFFVPLVLWPAQTLQPLKEEYRHKG